MLALRRVLTANELSLALKSRGVQISCEQCTDLICDFYGKAFSPSVALFKEDWPQFVHGLAVSNLHFSAGAGQGSLSDV